ncbi:unnamed protein product [Lampetra fluviatilis]
MLELSRDLGIPMPVCGHEKLTSRMAAKCLDAQFNLRRWKQVTAWTGGPVKDGDALGWNPAQAVYVPDDRGPQQLTAASAPWTGRGGPRPRAVLPERGRQEARPALRRNEAECFRCGRRGHYARDCWARFPAPPQQEASAPVKQAGRDIAGDEGPCSEDACQVCGTFEPCSPSDPAAGTVTGQAQD